ncbi:MAG: very short patch repair endonuclease [Lachnospiraceae bacterium]|nr:very short patch repair endonuclease [Lachnospiraceae bacterium]
MEKELATKESTKDEERNPHFHGTVSEARHRNMSRIRSKDTGIELALRKALWKKGYRYRKNYKALPGTPDIALTKYKIAIFCDGEFFHGKNWNCMKKRLQGGNNAEYWIKKIERNMERDLEKEHSLLYEGWTVIRFWGKDIEKNLEGCIKVIEEAIFEKQLPDNLL